jgi:ESF2/ABP1 family protein
MSRDISIHEEEDHDILPDHFDDDNNIENVDEYNEKIKASGMIYISHIPEGMNVAILRSKLENYGIKRIYLVPDKKQGNKRQTYKEGWVEFEEKLMAKLSEYELNGKEIGGKKKQEFAQELWTIKYLHKFKWTHLMEKIQHTKKLREHKVQAEVKQAHRENQFILKNFEKSKVLDNLGKKRDRGDLAEPIKSKTNTYIQKKPLNK